MEGNPRVENRGELGGGDPGKYRRAVGRGRRRVRSVW
jgi:hypothetical protein